MVNITRLNTCNLINTLTIGISFNKNTSLHYMCAGVTKGTFRRDFH